MAPNRRRRFRTETEAAVAAVGQVRERGQVTLPEDVLREAGVEPGDMVAFRAVAPGTVEIKVLDRLTLAEALEKFKIEGPLDKATRRVRQHEPAAETVEPKDLPPLTLAEMIARL